MQMENIKLEWAKLKLTEHCNLECTKCNYRLEEDKFNHKSQLTTTEVINVIDDCEKLGIRKIKFLGGEATIRKDFVSLVAHCSSKGLKAYVTTNGTLITELYARQLVLAGLRRVTISLDSFDARVHDKLVNRVGSWEKTVAAINYFTSFKHLSKHSLIISIAVVVDTMNVKDIYEMCKFCRDLKVDEVNLLRINVDEMTDKQLALTSKDIVTFSKNEVSRLIALTTDTFNIEFNFGYDPRLDIDYDFIYDKISCLSSFQGLYISAEGNVYPCCPLKDEEFWMGNIRKNTLEEIIGSSKYAAHKKKCVAPLEFKQCQTCYDVTKDNILLSRSLNA